MGRLRRGSRPARQIKASASRSERKESERAMAFAPGYQQIGDDWFSYRARKGFSGDVVADCGADSPNFGWLRDRLRTQVPAGDFWFYVNGYALQSDSEETRIANAVTAQIGVHGRNLILRIVTRF